MDPQRLRLYVIPDAAFGGGRSLLDQAERALAGGATAIQLRDKAAGGRALYDLALAFKALCRSHGALLFVNDRLDVALAAGADGVHLGQSDLPAAGTRPLVPPGFLIGVSASRPEWARAAEADGADYLGVGALYPTGTKGDARHIGLDGLRAVRAATRLPIVGIGGIHCDAVGEILAAGADGVAVVSAIVGAPDIAAEARRFRQRLDEAVTPPR
ncbi:MAG: thiamine phosphate synthase [Candidatus Sumerlaeia bacterium]|nr:thiamine phosphate synthase [Candidatus Sumerlaeia bacterium]